MLFVILFTIYLAFASCAPKEDEILHLPGLNDVINFKHYSGYLDGSKGDHLHYWFVESQKNPSKDPVVLWMNGGPGCSSLDGLLNELGPYLISEGGETLYKNSFSWNKIASILFLESPPCVGFSYNDSGDCATSDDEVSLMNYNALKSFYKKFPELKENDLYITGESYAGIYVPTLSVRVLQGRDSFPMNFKGYAIGNGLSSYDLNDESIIFFSYYHGLIGPELWQNLLSSCCKDGIPTQENCYFGSKASFTCRNFAGKTQEIIYNRGLNMYNLYAKCIHPGNTASTSHLSRYHVDRHNLFLKLRSRNNSGHLYSKAKVYENLMIDPPCVDSKDMRKYLNDPEVKKSLHISPSAPVWDVCSWDVNFAYKRQYANMRRQYALLTKHVRGLIYNGDVDMACNFLGDEWFVESLGLKVTEGRRIWLNADQVGGFVKRFKNVDLLTIRGAGHMVPQDKPAAAYSMFSSFINNTPY